MSMDAENKKKLLGARASVELFNAVEKWRSQNPNKSQTDFVLQAAVEKLEREGIQFDRIEALRDGRTKPAKVEPSAAGGLTEKAGKDYDSKKPSSSPGRQAANSDAAEILDKHVEKPKNS